MFPSWQHSLNMSSALSDQCASPTIPTTVLTNSDLKNSIMQCIYPCKRHKALILTHKSNRLLATMHLVIPNSEVPFISLCLSLLPASVSSPSNDSVANDVLLLKSKRGFLLYFFLLFASIVKMVTTDISKCFYINTKHFVIFLLKLPKMLLHLSNR